MPTVIVHHDLPIANAIEERIVDINVVDVETTEKVPVSLKSADALITNPTLWSDDFIDSLEKGNWIQATSAGYAAFPVTAFRDLDINFTNASKLHDEVVSEHALTLAFSLSRNLSAIFTAQRERKWDRTVGAEMWDWKGQRLTVFGLGNIGEAVARRGQAFGFNVFGVKRSPSNYSGCLSRDRVVGTDKFPHLLQKTDLLILTVPLTNETRRIVNQDIFSQLPNNAVLVNVARGGVVDHDALLEALKDGELRAAALDVTDPEPLPQDSPLWKRNDVIISPHVGGRSENFVDRFCHLFAANYERWRVGDSLLNQIV